MSTNHHSIPDRNKPLLPHVANYSSLPVRQTNNAAICSDISLITHQTEGKSDILATRINIAPKPHFDSKDSNSITSPPIYRDSSQCQPFFRDLHAFENAHFGNDFTCEGNAFDDFKRWFDAEAYFCAASFSRENTIISVISLLFVTEASAIRFINGEIMEHNLIPYTPESNSRPVVYCSAFIAIGALDSVRLHKIVLKDILSYKKKYNVTPCWGFSVCASDNGFKYLSNSGFYKIESKSFMNKYYIVKIDHQSTQSKIWKSIFSQPEPHLTIPPKNAATTVSRMYN